MNKIKECRICKNPDIKEFLDLEDQPHANSLLTNLEEKETFYPLSLSWCPECNLVQLNHTLDPRLLFSNYVWVTETSKVAKEHAKRFYNEILSRVNNVKDSYVLELASNDGTFLIPFKENGFKVLGVDPAKNIAEIAKKRGIPTEVKFFGEGVAEEIVKEHGLSKVVLARNVVPHVANLHSFIEGLKTCLDNEGILVIETHYAKIISEQLHYDSIYHEHLCYFTLKSMEYLLNLHNLYIFDIIESPISGGSLIYYIKKKKTEESPNVKKYRDEEEKTKLNEFSNWKNFSKRTYEHKNKLLEILKKHRGTVIGYGASARSSTLLNFCNINNRLIKMIADKNPLKHRKYTAGTHILIEGPDKAIKSNPDLIFLLAWNFTDEIINILKEEYNFKGQCIIPLPNDPKVIHIN